MKLFPGMTAYVSIPVASVSNVVKIPNAALRYKPDLPPEPRAAATPSQEPGGGTREHAASGSNATPDIAVVWKLLPDKSLQPIQARIGLTDHTYTAAAAPSMADRDGKRRCQLRNPQRRRRLQRVAPASRW